MYKHLLCIHTHFSRVARQQVLTPVSLPKKHGTFVQNVNVVSRHAIRLMDLSGWLHMPFESMQFDMSSCIPRG